MNSQAFGPDDIDTAGLRAGPAGTRAAHPDATDIAIVDWDTLFVAVKARLRQAVQPCRQVQSLLRETSRQTREQVLQCVEALDQLHATMLHHIERGRALEAALTEAQSSEARWRAELARAQDSESTARHLASHDDLTTLPNGAGFRLRLADVLREAATHGQAFAVLYIDLDDFKAINDAHGHATGDQVLRLVAARLSGAVRAGDMVCRMGGDEFACLLWGAPPGRTALDRLAASLFDTVSAPFQIGTHNLTVCPSIGVAMWPADGLTAEHLIEHADAAMYRAKRQHSGHSFFDGGVEA